MPKDPNVKKPHSPPQITEWQNYSDNLRGLWSSFATSTTTSNITNTIPFGTLTSAVVNRNVYNQRKVDGISITEGYPLSSIVGVVSSAFQLARMSLCRLVDMVDMTLTGHEQKGLTNTHTNHWAAITAKGIISALFIIPEFTLKALVTPVVRLVDKVGEIIMKGIDSFFSAIRNKFFSSPKETAKASTQSRETSITKSTTPSQSKSELTSSHSQGAMLTKLSVTKDGPEISSSGSSLSRPSGSISIKKEEEQELTVSPPQTPNIQETPVAPSTEMTDMQAGVQKDQANSQGFFAAKKQEEQVKSEAVATQNKNVAASKPEPQKLSQFQERLKFWQDKEKEVQKTQTSHTPKAPQNKGN